MPFTTLPLNAGPLPSSTVTPVARPQAYPTVLPDPLVTAILDRPYERGGLTTAILVYGFKYTHAASGAEIKVPPGFITDFASIPAAARMVIPPFGRHAKAAVLHDWLYAIGEPGRKAFADRIFLAAMEELEVDPVIRSTMYEAVHLFGQEGYDRADYDWPHSWGDWATGEYLVSPPATREAWFVAKWPKPPRPDWP